MKKKQIYSIQEWLPFEKILDKGIIKMKDSSYIKIMKIIPINFNLKSNFEKDAILNSYKVFLKTYDFDIQIIIQSNKEDLTPHISNLIEPKSEKILKIKDNYIKYILNLNKEKKSSIKNFYLIIKNPNIEKNPDTTVIDNLNEQFFKIKECLSRCGNLVEEINDLNETNKLLSIFLNNKNFKEVK